MPVHTECVFPFHCATSCIFKHTNAFCVNGLLDWCVLQLCFQYWMKSIYIFCPVHSGISFHIKDRCDWLTSRPVALWPPSLSHRSGSMADRYGPQTPGTNSGCVLTWEIQTHADINNHTLWTHTHTHTRTGTEAHSYVTWGRPTYDSHTGRDRLLFTGQLVSPHIGPDDPYNKTMKLQKILLTI